MSKIFYTASSAEDYKKLEDSMTKFLEHYTVNVKSNAVVSFGFDNCTRIAPQSGRIESIESKKAVGGRLERYVDQFIKISLNGDIYQINLDSKSTC